MPDNIPPKKAFFTRRLLLSILGLISATTLVVIGRMGAEQWDYALAIILAGHHLADIISAWRGK